jgi:2'-5' RNA ligase
MSGGALTLRVDGLDELAAEIAERTASIGRPPGPSFRGHLTIARLRRGVRPPRLAPFEGAEFAVHDVALIRSTLGRDHARYETMHTWPTRAR